MNDEDEEFSEEEGVDIQKNFLKTILCEAILAEDEDGEDEL